MSADGDERDVLRSLPRTRPARRSTKRDAAAKPKVAATKPKAAPNPRAKAKTTAKPKAAAKPRATAKPRTQARPKATAHVKPPPAGWATPDTDAAPSGGELVTTAIRAAAELAEIGATYGLQAVRRAISRLPRP